MNNFLGQKVLGNKFYDAFPFSTSLNIYNNVKQYWGKGEDGVLKQSSEK